MEPETIINCQTRVPSSLREYMLHLRYIRVEKIGRTRALAALEGARERGTSGHAAAH